MSWIEEATTNGVLVTCKLRSVDGPEIPTPRQNERIDHTHADVGRATHRKRPRKEVMQSLISDR